VAIRTACPSLDSIVVDTAECGQRCIDFLRDNDLGRADFVCLDKLPKEDMSMMTPPRNAIRLLDMIKPLEPKYAQAFYVGIANTLVATTQEEANILAFGSTRYRVVTLDGQLIDTQGSMSGGNSRSQRSGMSLKSSEVNNCEVTEESIVKLELECVESEKTLSDLSSYRIKLEDDDRVRRAALTSLETRIANLVMEIGLVNSAINEIECCIKLAVERKALLTIDKPMINNQRTPQKIEEIDKLNKKKRSANQSASVSIEQRSTSKQVRHSLSS